MTSKKKTKDINFSGTRSVKEPEIKLGDLVSFSHDEKVIAIVIKLIDSNEAKDLVEIHWKGSTHIFPRYLLRKLG
jgi:hypothetical protein